MCKRPLGTGTPTSTLSWPSLFVGPQTAAHPVFLQARLDRRLVSPLHLAARIPEIERCGASAEMFATLKAMSSLTNQQPIQRTVGKRDCPVET
jgi:hypothetical protein